MAAKRRIGRALGATNPQRTSTLGTATVTRSSLKGSSFAGYQAKMRIRTVDNRDPSNAPLGIKPVRVASLVASATSMNTTHERLGS